jgi:signal transduction histidine kinase
VLRRLLGGLLPLLLLFAAGLALPLAGIVADRATQVVYLDRVADADRFATVADRALRAGRQTALTDELHQYFLVYGIRAWVLGVDGSTKLSADGSPPPPSVLADRDVDLAERGVQPDPPGPVSPTGHGDLLVAAPIGIGAEAIGAVVTLSPLDALRHEIALRWALRAAIAAAITVVLAGAAWPFSRWLLRPVARLDEAAGEIAAGRIASRVGLAAGPPELRRLAVSFDRMAEVVERTMHRQQQFVADASHQLRTPLTSLRLALENLGAELPPDLDEGARLEYGEALEEARSMGRMLDGLLSLTRLATEPGEVEDVAEVLADGEVGWRARCTAARMTLRVEVAPGTWAVTPPGGLRHLLDELVENACRLSGGTALAVTARTGPSSGPDDTESGAAAGAAAGAVAGAAAGAGAGTVTVTVRDDGVGLDADHRTMATRRFWRAPQQQNTPGGGLGLAIVSELVAASDGRVALRDAEPGLEVVLTLLPPPTVIMHERVDHALRGPSSA